MEVRPRTVQTPEDDESGVLYLLRVYAPVASVDVLQGSPACQGTDGMGALAGAQDVGEPLIEESHVAEVIKGQDGARAVSCLHPFYTTCNLTVGLIPGYSLKIIPSLFPHPLKGIK